MTSAIYLDRLDRVRAEMAERGIDVLMLSVGHDLPYLTGYLAMPLERLTMLVVPHDGEASLVIPQLEAPRVVEQPGVFTLVPWGETADPIEIVAKLSPGAATVAVGDQMWSRFLVELLPHLPGATYTRAVDVVGPLRMVKDAAEIAALRAAGDAADRVANQLHAGDIPLVGRTEAQVSKDIGARLIAEGHQRVNFAIVAAGPNAASPHHHASDRVITAGEIVLCDFGGTMDGYCSDTTRCVFTGEPAPDVAEAYAVLHEAQAAGPNAASPHHHASDRVITAGEIVLCDFGGTMDGYCSDTTRCVFTGVPAPDVAEAYAVLHEAQAAAVAAATVGTPCEDVDRAARNVIAAAGYGEYFIHRTGHGIGLEEHEDPYIVEGNTLPLRDGHAFSIEPGIYVPGKWGMRLEDIVVAADSGPDSLNNSDHALVAV